MTQEQEKYLEKWLNDLDNKVETLEKEIADIEKRKNISKASKDAMLEVRKDILEDTRTKSIILGELQLTAGLYKKIIDEQIRIITNQGEMLNEQTTEG